MKNIVSFSGGKDSTAMLLMMIEKGMQIDEVVFGDTTLEYPEMYEYINKIEKIIGLKIIKTKAKKEFDEWVFGEISRGKRKGQIRGLPLTSFHCFWHREAKEYALKPYTKNNNVFIGIALDEKHRAKTHRNFNAIYPLVEWGITEKQCYDYLLERDLLNPLYNHVKRTGCYLCPKQSLQSLKFTYNYHPELWEKMKLYENKTGSFHPDYKLIDKENKFKIENRQVNLFES